MKTSLRELMGLGRGEGPYTEIPVKVWLPILAVGLTAGILMRKLAPLPAWASWGLAAAFVIAGWGASTVILERRSGTQDNQRRR